MTMDFPLVQINMSGKHSKLNFAHHFVIYWLLQTGRSHTKEKPYMINSQKLGRQKSQKRKQNTCMYVSRICAKGIFVFSLVTKKLWKVGQK